ncbi:MAG: hypothetical protein R8G66_31435 [Cytophagales bacterium]|nr:hypothetical protein [Cytophagales bacterium]
MSANIPMLKLNHKLLLLVFLVPMVVLGQIDTEEFGYSREFTWGINKNTNSGLIGGFSFKLARKSGDQTYRTFGLDVLNVKHPKELRVPQGPTGSSFIFGKQNFLYSIRGHYGIERIIFRKASQQGVQINVNAAGGPSLGIEAPYYVLAGGSTEVYDPNLHTSPFSIQGSGRLFQGLGESKLIPGLNVRSSVLFEFGTFRKNVVGLELGLAAEAFSRKIIIVPTHANRAIYTSAFFTLFWGSRK